MSKKNTQPEKIETYRVVLYVQVVSYVDATNKAQAIKTAEANIEDGSFKIIETTATTEGKDAPRADAVFLDEGTYYTGDFAVINVAQWTNEDWQRIEEAGDNGRLKLACEIDDEKKL